MKAMSNGILETLRKQPCVTGLAADADERIAKNERQRVQAERFAAELHHAAGFEDHRIAEQMRRREEAASEEAAHVEAWKYLELDRQSVERLAVIVAQREAAERVAALADRETMVPGKV